MNVSAVLNCCCIYCQLIIKKLFLLNVRGCYILLLDFVQGLIDNEIVTHFLSTNIAIIMPMTIL